MQELNSRDYIRHFRHNITLDDTAKYLCRYDSWHTGRTINFYVWIFIIFAVSMLTPLTMIAQDTKKAITGAVKEMHSNLAKGAKTDIHSVMRKYLDGIKAKALNEPGYSVPKRWQRLFASEVMEFTVDTTQRLADNAIRDGKNHVQNRTFRNIYIAICVIRSINDKTSMRLFPAGYFQVLDGLLKESGWLQDDRDLTHWIYCYEESSSTKHI